jgi:uncharacterized protein YvpB
VQHKQQYVAQLFLAKLSFLLLFLLLATRCGQNALRITEDAVQTTANFSGEKILHVKNIQQLPELPSGCEVTSSAIVINYLGFQISKTELADFFPIGGMPHHQNGVIVGPNPWKEFAGSPYENGYGCFAPVVTSALNQYLSSIGSKMRAVNLSGTNARNLLGYIDNGIPVIVWATISMKEPYDGNSWYLQDTEELFTWPAREHCLVLIGYSGGNVILCDPLNSQGTTRCEMSLFEKRYKQLYCQAVVVQ